MSRDPNVQRFVCPRCKRTKATDRPFAECEYCGEGMVPMVTWVRRQMMNKKPGDSSEKEMT